MSMPARYDNPVVQATYDPIEGRMVVYVIGGGTAMKMDADDLPVLKDAMAQCATACGMATKPPRRARAKPHVATECDRLGHQEDKCHNTLEGGGPTYVCRRCGHVR